MWPWRFGWWNSSTKYLKCTCPGKTISCLHTLTYMYMSLHASAWIRNVLLLLQKCVAQQYQNQMYAQTCQEAAAIHSLGFGFLKKCFSHQKMQLLLHCAVPRGDPKCFSKWSNLSILYLMQMRHLQIRISVIQPLILEFSVLQGLWQIYTLSLSDRVCFWVCDFIGEAV